MTAPYIRPTVEAIEEQQILAVSKLALGDKSVIPLWYGESDLSTDAKICEATVASLRDGETFYSQKHGLPSLQSALSDYLTDLHGRTVDTGRITVTASGMSAIMMGFQIVLDAGDNAIVVSPVWPNAQSVVRALGGEVRFCPIERTEGGRWDLDLDRLKAMCDDRTRAIFVNAPNNPTGWVMRRELMADMLDFARESGIWIFSDEVYGRMVYDGKSAPSFLDMMEPDDPVIVFNSFSKSWAMTGWRIGWMVHPARLADLLGNMVEFNYSCTPTFVQRGAEYAIRHGEGIVKDMIDHCRRGRDICDRHLPDLPRVSGYAQPEASFYAFFRIERTEDRTLETAQDLVLNAKVGIAPGTAFGPGGEGWYRLCFAQTPETLSEAFARLEKGLASL